jgi:splicing factor 3A subunit 3
MGKKHMKLSQEEAIHDPEEEERAREQYREEHEKRKKSLAVLEYRIGRLREDLASVIYDTMNLVRKKQTRGYEEVEENEESSSES